MRVLSLLLVGVNADTTAFPYTLRASHTASETSEGNWSDPDDSFEMAVALMAVSSLIGFCVVTVVESCWAKDIEDAKDELLKRRAIVEGLRILYEEEASSSSEDAPSLGMEHGILNLWQPKEFYDVLINLGQQKGPNPNLLQSVPLSVPYPLGDLTRVPSECSESADTESEDAVSESPPVFETFRLSTPVDVVARGVFEIRWRSSQAERALDIPEPLLALAARAQAESRVADQEEMYVVDFTQMLQDAVSLGHSTICQESLNWLIYSGGGLEAKADEFDAVVNTLRAIPTRPWLREWLAARESCMEARAAIDAALERPALPASLAKELLAHLVQETTRLAIIGEDLEWLTVVVAVLLSSPLGRKALATVLTPPASFDLESPKVRSLSRSLSRTNLTTTKPAYTRTLRELGRNQDAGGAQVLLNCGRLGFQLGGVVFRRVDSTSHWNRIRREILSGKRLLFDRDRPPSALHVAMDRNGIHLHACPLVDMKSLRKVVPTLPVQFTRKQYDILCGWSDNGGLFPSVPNTNGVSTLFCPRVIVGDTPFLSAEDAVAVCFMSVGIPADVCATSSEQFQSNLKHSRALIESISVDDSWIRLPEKLLHRSGYLDWVYRYRMGGRPASPNDLLTFAKALPRVRPFVVHVTPDGVTARELRECPRVTEFHLDLARVLARDLDEPVDNVELFIPILEHDFCEAVERHLETTVEFLGHNVVVYTIKGPPTSSELSTRRTRERRRWGGPLWQPSLWGPEYVIFPAVSSFDISVSESTKTVTCGRLPATLVALVEALLKLPISELGPGSVSEIVAHHGLHETWTKWELYLLLTSDLSSQVVGTPSAKRYLKEMLACQIVTKAIKKVALQETTRSREADWHNVVTSVLEVVMYQMFSNDVTQDPNVDAAAESLSVALWLDVIACVTFLPVLPFSPDLVDELLEAPPRRPYCFAQCLAHYLGVELKKQCLYRLLMHDPSVVIDDKGSMENQLYNLLQKPPSQQSRRGSFSRRISVQYERRKFADEEPLKEGRQCNQWMGCPQRPVPLSAKGFKHLHLHVSSEIKRVISAANLTSDTIVSKIHILNQRLEFWRPPGFEPELTGDSPHPSDSKQDCFLELLPVLPCHSLGNIRYVRAFMSLQTCLHIIVNWLVNPPGPDDIITAKTALSHLFNHLVPVASLLSDYTNDRLVPMRLLSQFYLAESLWLVFRVHVDALEEKRPVRRRRLTKPIIHRRRSSAAPPMLTAALSDLKESDDGRITHSRALGLLLTSIALDVRQSGRPDVCFGRQGLVAKSMMAAVLARDVRMPELCALLVDVAASQAARLQLNIRATAGSVVVQIGQHLRGLELWDFPVCDELVLKNPSLDLKYVGLQPLTVDLKLQVERSRISSFHLGHMPVLTKIGRFSQTQRATQSAWVVGRNENCCTAFPSEAFPRLDQLQLLPLPDTDVVGIAAGAAMSVVVERGAVHLLGSVRGVHSIVNVEQVATGDGFVVAKTSDGNLFSWGSSAEGALGLGSVKSTATPRRLAVSEPIQHLAVGRGHACAVSHYGAMFTWGRADAGALGLSTSRLVTLPTQVFILEVLLDVPLVMWKEDSRVRELQLPPEYEPVHISAHKSTLFCCVAASYYDEPPPDVLLFSQVACGDDGTVCTDICGNVWLFGSYADQVEDQRTVLFSTSTCKIALAAFNNQPAAVAAGRKAIGVLDVEGSLWVAGSNASGLLGCGDLKRSKQLVRSPAFAGRIVTCISFSAFASWAAAVVGGVCFVWGRDSPIDTPLAWKPQAVSQFPMHLLDIQAGGGHLVVLVSPRPIPNSIL